MSETEKTIDPKIIEELIKTYKKPEDLLGEGGILKTLQKALLERVLEGELTDELGYSKHESKGNGSGNSRNGHSQKMVQGNQGKYSIQVPRDRNGDYSPKILPKHHTRFDGFDDKIMSLYARGMTVRDIQAQLEELYGVEVSASLISTVTHEVMDEVKSWQSRPLDKIYPIVYLDALMIKINENKRVINKAFYLVVGVNVDGEKELLGIWISEHEGAKFWLSVLTDLKNRGVEDILIACVDGLTGFPDAIEAVYPKAQVQLCIVHMVRQSLRYVSWKNRKAVVADLKAIYGSNTVEEAELALVSFAERWDTQYPAISKSWQAKWTQITPFFAYPPDIRRVIYTTNAIESINMSLRKVIKHKRMFPSEDAALKQLYMALKNISKKWTMPVRDWKTAMNFFMVMFGERLTGVL
jgi:putative transposase